MQGKLHPLAVDGGTSRLAVLRIPAGQQEGNRPTDQGAELPRLVLNSAQHPGRNSPRPWSDLDIRARMVLRPPGFTKALSTRESEGGPVLVELGVPIIVSELDMTTVSPTYTFRHFGAVSVRPLPRAVRVAPPGAQPGQGKEGGAATHMRRAAILARERPP